MEIEATAEIELRCSKHHNNLEGSQQLRSGVWIIDVEPCDDCLVDAEEGTYK